MVKYQLLNVALTIYFELAARNYLLKNVRGFPPTELVSLI